ncbi:MAG TPA: transglutaminase family protein, partial [Acidobacteriaceae bacterium]|nr:transglutaminase family protein [Acidobacteriaceae bacterium]
MGIQVALQHETRYRYQRPVSLGPQTIQLRPAPHCRTPILSYSLDVIPADCLLSWQFDPLANHIARAIFPTRTAEFLIQVHLVADLEPINPFAFLLEPSAENYPFPYPSELTRDLATFLHPTPSGTLFHAFLAELPSTPQPTVSFLVDLNARVRDRIHYAARLEYGVQSPEETLALGTGSCRDSAWLLVELCRHLGIAARFVSGYLIQLAEDHQNQAAPNTDSADLHAWAEVYLPGAGWIGMDPTSGFLAAECHIPLAVSSTPSAAAPIGGTVEPAEVEFTHTLSIRRLNQPSDLIHPCTDEDWQQVRDLAHHIDRELIAHDVRLTMGGEPTLVGIDEPETPQWNTEALGPLKRTRGLALIRSLRQRTAPGALLHFGQGKWYPGEALPRWAFHCIYRTDGVPVWENGDLFALELEDHQDNFTHSGVLAFLQALTRRLAVTSESILPAIEPSAEPGTEPTGYILPLRRRQPSGRLSWSSQLWFDRPERFILSPGDSPIGYRIPVSSMPWVAPDTLVYSYEQDAEGNEIPGRVKLPP